MASTLDPYTKGDRPKKSADKTHKSSKAKAGSSSGSGSSPPFSFLFVVNELHFYDVEPSDFHRDMWQNLLPPRNRLGYTNEIPSRVMRYQGGEVTEARGYQWYRPGLQQPGYCLEPMRGQALECYSHFAVFSCSPHLPIVVVQGDPLTCPDAEQTMHALHFFHPGNQELRGVSQATTTDRDLPVGGHPPKYVAGRSPSWIPGLVPPAYANPAAPVPSRGLGGELPIVLGLTAFSEAHGPGVSADAVYLGRDGHRGRWRDRVWMNSHPPALYPPLDQAVPRGFYVAVFFDPQNPDDSTREWLWSFEWEGVIVKEHHPGSSSSPRR